MVIDLVYRNLTSKRAYTKAFFEHILKKSAQIARLRGTLELSVSLVGPARMRALNKKYRRKDRSTDVLSFPLYDKLPKRYNEVSLGDIFISPAIVAQKARKQRKSEKEYMAWATVHGFLHLAGYDHERSAAEEKKMDALEVKILNRLK